eukprot:818814_1
MGASCKSTCCTTVESTRPIRNTIDRRKISEVLSKSPSTTDEFNMDEEYMAASDKSPDPMESNCTCISDCTYDTENSDFMRTTNNIKITSIHDLLGANMTVGTPGTNNWIGTSGNNNKNVLQSGDSCPVKQNKKE